MLNSADQAKLVRAVERILSFMVNEKTQQLKVRHSDLHKMANLGNARIGQLAGDVDMYVLKNQTTIDIFGQYMVVDYEIKDGEYIMCFVKKQKLVNMLTWDTVTDTLGRVQ